MITLFSGTPGSGKSYHAVKLIVEKLRLGRNVIANFPLDLSQIRGIRGRFFYVDDDNLTVSFLCKYALKFHKKGKENQSYIVIDEAQRLFNPRDFSRPDRRDWCKFFSLHRHLGFSCILISQHDRLLDRQIRYQIEYDVKHRAVSNYNPFFLFLGFIGFKPFIAITYWYAVKGEKCGVELFRYRRKYGRLYDSYALFDVSAVEALADSAAHRRGDGGPAEHGSAGQDRNEAIEVSALHVRLLAILCRMEQAKMLGEISLKRVSKA